MHVTEKNNHTFSFVFFGCVCFHHTKIGIGQSSENLNRIENKSNEFFHSVEGKSGLRSFLESKQMQRRKAQKTKFVRTNGMSHNHTTSSKLSKRSHLSLRTTASYI